MAIPRKRRGSATQHEKALERFYDTVVQAVLRHVNFEVVKAVVVASPGFVKDQFLEYLKQYSIKNDVKGKLVNGSWFGQVGPVDSYGQVGDLDPSLVNSCNLSRVGQVRPVDSCGQVRNIDPSGSK